MITRFTKTRGDYLSVFSSISGVWRQVLNRARKTDTSNPCRDRINRGSAAFRDWYNGPVDILLYWFYRFYTYWTTSVRPQLKFRVLLTVSLLIKQNTDPFDYYVYWCESLNPVSRYGDTEVKGCRMLWRQTAFIVYESWQHQIPPTHGHRNEVTVHAELWVKQLFNFSRLSVQMRSHWQLYN